MAAPRPSLVVDCSPETDWHNAGRNLCHLPLIGDYYSNYRLHKSLSHHSLNSPPLRLVPLWSKSMMLKVADLGHRQTQRWSMKRWTTLGEPISSDEPKMPWRGCLLGTLVTTPGTSRSSFSGVSLPRSCFLSGVARALGRQHTYPTSCPDTSFLEPVPVHAVPVHGQHCNLPNGLIDHCLIELDNVIFGLHH